MSSHPEGIPVPEQQKTLMNCPLLSTFLQPIEEVKTDLNSWYAQMQKYADPLRKELVDSEGTQAYCDISKLAQAGFEGQGIIDPNTDSFSIAMYIDRLILIGYEIGSVKDIYSISKRLTDQMIRLQLINPKFLTVRKEDDLMVEQAVLEPVLEGARIKEDLRGVDPLRQFRTADLHI